jgi:hypothetical protein
LHISATRTSVNIERLKEIQIYPIPAHDYINVQTGNFKNTDYILTDLSGKLVCTGQIYNGQGQINIERLPIGAYLFTTYNERVNLIIKR